MLEKLRRQLTELLEKRTTAHDANTEILTRAQARAADEQDLTDAEATEFRTNSDTKKTCDTQITEVRTRIADLEDEQRRDDAAAELRTELGHTDTERRTPTRVTKEERTYRPDSTASFFSDAYAVRNGDPVAGQRLARHANEERIEKRAVGTGNMGGLIVPQYLVEEFAAVLRNGRPLANAVRGVPLPDEGMALVIPRGNTGTATAAQATQNAAVQNTDLDFNNDLTINVRTIAGQQDVSRQSIERGHPGNDALVYADLVADYATKLDTQIIANDGTNGTHKGLLSATGTNAVTYTDASPTVPEIWSKLANAKGLIGANRKMAANLWVMTTTRWAWFVAALDSQNRPLLVDDPSAAVNAMGKSTAENFGEGQLVGTLQGTPVLVDDNIPANLGAGTNEDRIFAIRRQDPILWEEGDGMPRELRFEETSGGSLTVKLVVYGYSAFTAERYAKAVTIISGTGLVQPTF